MQRSFLFYFFIFLLPTISYSQVIVGPLKYDPQRAEKNLVKALRIQEDTIQSLPFFDDFANYHGNPNPEIWESDGGVFINDSYGINPPSYNVATFDGLNEVGHSYNQTDPYAEGSADKLTSLPLNLSSYNAGDSLYISFYWQAGGLGELPDPTEGDYLRLEFKDSSDIWNIVWEVKEDSTPFIQTLVPIKDNKYFFEGFQFRFGNYGSLAGSYDVWNLDYIYLSDNRSATDTNYVDLAIVTTPGSFLNRYTAIPYNQFYPHWESEVKDSLEFKVRNHSNDVIPLLMNNTADSVNLIKESLSNAVIDSFSVSTFAMAKMDTVVKWKLPYDKISALSEPVILKYHINPFVTDSVTFTANNQLVDSTVITNYYAYDDFTAEATFSHNDYGGALAVKYELNHPDSIVAVDINFIPYGNNLLDKRLDVSIWRSVDIGQSTEDLVEKKEVRLIYPENNGLARYYFDKPVAVTDIFYIGFTQYIRDFVHVGFDLNNNNRDKIFYKFRGAWAEYGGSDNPDGSLMIRPVMGGSHYIPITGITKPNNPEKISFTAEIFPNPTTGIVNVKGDVRSAIVYDLTGQTLQQKEFDLSDENKELDFSDANPGLYLVKLQGPTGFLIKKVILTR